MSWIFVLMLVIIAFFMGIWVGLMIEGALTTKCKIQTANPPKPKTKTITKYL